MESSNTKAKANARPIPEIEIKMVKNSRVVNEIEKMKKKRKKKNNQKPAKPLDIKDEFHLDIKGDDTHIPPPNFSFLKYHRKFLDEDQEPLPRTIEIGNLPAFFEEKQLFYYFRQFGKLIRVSVARNAETLKPIKPRVGYVEFARSDVADVVKEEFQNSPTLFDLEKVRVRLLEDNPNSLYSLNPKLLKNMKSPIDEEEKIMERIQESFKRDRVVELKESDFIDEENEKLKKEQKIDYTYNRKRKRNEENDVEEKNRVMKKRKIN